MKWDLSRLYNGFSDPAFEADMLFVKRFTDEIHEKFLHPLPTVKEQLKDLINSFNEMQKKTRRLSAMISLTLAADAENEEALKIQDRTQKLMIGSGKLYSAFSRYVGEIDNLDEILASDETLTEHAFYIREKAKAAGHTIDPALEETVLNLRLTGSGAWGQLRGTLESTLKVKYDENGEEKYLPLPAVRNLAHSPDPVVRKRAYEAELNAYPQIETAMAACLSSMKGEALTLLPLKKYSSLLEQTLETSRMDEETLSAMLSAMRESLPAFRKYLRAKAKKLGHENGLPFYDLFAPLGKETKSYTLDEAKMLLIDVLGRFSGKMADHIRDAFDNRLIDAYPREGKRGGAFCSSVHPIETSYVLTNFDGSLSSVSTLAHELGHAYHNRCLRSLSMLNCSYPMPLAETASIFNETLLMQKMLENANREEKISLLEQEISKACQVIVDILSRYIFETEVIERRKTHSLTARELKEIMLDAQKASYGDGLDENYLHPYMWACKSHYYRADLHFYNFPYAFGLLFGKGIYARYLARGESFVPEYDALLRKTATGNIKEVAESADIDVHSIDFWRDSLSVIKEDIETLSSLLEE
ncbi:MAG: M3 family oligoendopeptidase [Clostridia bacterium]|nr:M3 family oligoendopeptidase [Clostridia bacterium]